MITRALRVSEEYEGCGVTRALKKHVERVLKDVGVKRKAMTFGDPVFLEKVLREKTQIIFKKVNCYY